VEVLLVYFPGCPHVPATRAALARVLAEFPAARLREVDVSAADAPEELRGWGSPTVLVDGVDVAGGQPGTARSCRLYDSGEGPSEERIRAALAAKASRPEP